MFMVADNLSLTFSAIADPTRRAILSRLASGERSVTELARPFDMTMPAITKHLKVLERAGLIERGRQAQWRPCRLTAAPLKNASAWIDQYRKFWEDSLDRLSEYLQILQSAAKPQSAATKSAAAQAVNRAEPKTKSKPKSPTSLPRKR